MATTTEHDECYNCDRCGYPLEWPKPGLCPMCQCDEEREAEGPDDPDPTDDHRRQCSRFGV